MTQGTPPVDGDAHHKIVRGFTHPAEEWRSMARIARGEAATWGIYANRHARRAKRNEHRLLIMRDVALETRSEEGWGSEQGAGVAKQRVAGPANVLDQLLGTNGAGTNVSDAAPATIAGTSGASTN